MANGGIIGPVQTTSRGDFQTVFTSSGNYCTPGHGPGTASVLVVAGGGGGGGYGGGGGAGGYRLINCHPIPSSQVPVTIGSGGAGGKSPNPGIRGSTGSDSVFGSGTPLTSCGGGGGSRPHR